MPGLSVILHRSSIFITILVICQAGRPASFPSWFGFFSVPLPCLSRALPASCPLYCGPRSPHLSLYSLALSPSHVHFATRYTLDSVACVEHPASYPVRTGQSMYAVQMSSLLFQFLITRQQVRLLWMPEPLHYLLWLFLECRAARLIIVCIVYKAVSGSEAFYRNFYGEIHPFLPPMPPIQHSTGWGRGGWGRRNVHCLGGNEGATADQSSAQRSL